MEEKSLKLTSESLALFFTYGVSLDLWQSRGVLEREMAIYKLLGKSFQKIYFVTYGANDGSWREALASYNVEILPKKSALPNFLYSFLIPWYYRKELKNCRYFKTNQMLGSWSAVICKIVYGGRLLVRTGYTLSLFQKNNPGKYCLAKVIERVALRFADVFSVATDREKKYFSRVAAKVKVLPNYVDTDLFSPADQPGGGNPARFLFVGRLSPQKNLENFLRAFGGLQNVHLDIVGNGELEHKLKSLAESFNLDITFRGNLPNQDLPNLINHSDIFVLPSHYEGNPKVLLEAMACGAVVLGAQVDGIDNIVEDGVNGFLMGTSVEAMRFALARVISLEEGERNHIREQARQFILENYCLDKIASQELEIYNKI